MLNRLAEIKGQAANADVAIDVRPRYVLRHLQRTWTAWCADVSVRLATPLAGWMSRDPSLWNSFSRMLRKCKVT